MKYPIKEHGPKVHADDVYVADEHELNLTIASRYLERFSPATPESGFSATPWMLSAAGIARVQETKKGLQTEFLEERGGPSALGPHFVKNTILLGKDYLETDGKLYPPFHYMFTLIFNYPVSAGMMMGYNTGADNPRDVGASIDRHLDLFGLGVKRPKPTNNEPTTAAASGNEGARVIDLSEVRDAQPDNTDLPTVDADLEASVVEFVPRKTVVPATLRNVRGVFKRHPNRLRWWAKVALPAE